MTIGKREFRQMLTAAFRLGSQASGGANTVFDQFSDRINFPNSPPPEKISLSWEEV